MEKLRRIADEYKSAFGHGDRLIGEGILKGVGYLQTGQVVSLNAEYRQLKVSFWSDDRKLAEGLKIVIESME